MAETFTLNQRIVEQNIERVAEFLTDAIADNLKLQGHNNTGKLLNSIEYVVRSFLDGLGFDVYMEHYAVFLDKGIKPERVPFTIGSGATKSKYINALIKWARTLPFITSQKQAKSFAFAVAKTAKREGHPTVGSHRFSQTGKRTGFFTDALNDSLPTIEQMFEVAMFDTIQIAIDDMVNEIQLTIKN